MDDGAELEEFTIKINFCCSWGMSWTIVFTYRIESKQHPTFQHVPPKKHCQ